MKEDRKFFELPTFDSIKTDRLMISGRRGTGKSTGWKKRVAEGRKVIACVRTVKLAKTLPQRFVPPAVADQLPLVELIDEDPDSPLFRFGAGCVKVVPLSAVVQIRDTGVSVDGAQAEAIILDECFPKDGRYKKDEPLLLDDLAATVGRSGKMPPIIVLGNPRSNQNPYAYQWKVNVLSEGLYESDGMTTQVVGTSECRDCFGRRIGIDAKAAAYAEHLDTGGDVVIVNDAAIRVRPISSWLYVGTADGSDGVRLMAKGRYTPASLSPAGTKFMLRCQQALMEDRVVFDSFAAELIFYELLRAKE